MPCLTKEQREAKRTRALAIREKNPNLSAADIAERLGLHRKTVEAWLTEAGLGQTRTEDARGQRPVPAAPGEVV
ncbi:hypothetical protein [Corallococcus exiguus]|uniref:hypothetical protein n=1 Tax=Corallococcus exiguus TaxID=83462 RepID=UPI00147128E6|nr:hypothetical protein [Corallococcus exiguus]NNB91285.1 hypothetical protein [Corallococcus exiguus]